MIFLPPHFSAEVAGTRIGGKSASRIDEATARPQLRPRRRLRGAGADAGPVSRVRSGRAARDLDALAPAAADRRPPPASLAPARDDDRRRGRFDPPPTSPHRRHCSGGQAAGRDGGPLAGGDAPRLPAGLRLDGGELRLARAPPIHLWVDMRAFRNPDGTTGLFTTGLAPLGHMEIEIPSIDMEPGEIREWLINIIFYLIENGPASTRSDHRHDRRTDDRHPPRSVEVRPSGEGHPSGALALVALIFT